MKIITISGKARHGKDFTANIMADSFRAKNKKVIIVHYADLLKFICKNMFGWDGKKDEHGRQLLQYIGTDVVRKKEPDFWVDYIISILKLFENEWDYVIIPDTRFPNEVDKLKAASFDVKSILVKRPNFTNGLSNKAMAHISEHALDDYHFDYCFINCGDSHYVNVVIEFVEKQCLNCTKEPESLYPKILGVDLSNTSDIVDEQFKIRKGK